MSDDAPPGVPEWVVTYGDMMSLLLTFFIMLVSLSEVVADKKYRAILDALHKYSGYRTGPVAPPGNNFPLNDLVSRLETLGSYTNLEQGRGGVKRQAIEGEEQRVFRMREGKPVRVGELILFPPHDLTLDAQARKQIEVIVQELAGKPNKIEIRGHTGDKPLPANSPYSNLSQLSYRRARLISDELVARGVEPDRIRLCAIGDGEPLLNEGDGSLLHADRVEVVLLDMHTEQLIGPVETPQ